MTQPKFALIPAAVKLASPANSKIYSVLPSNEDVDFNMNHTNQYSQRSRVTEDFLVEKQFEARLDWGRTALFGDECPSLTIGIEATNRITFSEEFDAFSWTQDNVAVINDAAISPSGELNGTLLKSTSGTPASGYHGVKQDFTNFQYGSFYKSMSCYVKKGDSKYCYMRYYEGSQLANELTLRFDFDTGIATLLSSNNTNVYRMVSQPNSLANGWYRLEIAFESAGWNESVMAIQPDFGRTVYVWGAQAEIYNRPENAGGPIGAQTYAFCAPYIYTLQSYVTQSDEDRVKTSQSNLFENPQGTFFVHIDEQFKGISTNRQAISISGIGSPEAGANRAVWWFDTGSQNNRVAISVQLYGSGAQTIFTFVSPYTHFTDTPNKMAISWSGSEIKVALNGGLAYTGSNPSGSVPTLLHTASFTSDSENFPFFGRTKDMRYYDEVLSNEELIELTLRN
ncbi:hypothetical protein N9E56_02795 [Flavobacteriaceae bacterium]|nr:hypothetical protein [Flavobacteriaceae bacterium]